MDKHERLRELERRAEAHYNAMYETRYPSAEYADAKDCLSDAILLARQLGEIEIGERLETRLEHIKAVFRSQFT